MSMLTSCGASQYRCNEPGDKTNLQSGACRDTYLKGAYITCINTVQIWGIWLDRLNCVQVSWIANHLFFEFCLSEKYATIMAEI